VVSEFRVFLSAVTSEFGEARDTLAASLRSRDLLLRVQSDFRQQAGSDTTLRKLHGYIHDCTAVVCILGRRSGAMPPVAAAEPFVHMLPAGVTEASYTQWEFFFARHYKRRLSLYIATSAWTPAKPAPAGDRPPLQDALIRYIETEQGLDRDYFGDVDRLCHLVLKEHWPNEKPPKPILLPYPSLGTLFKGRDAFMRRLRISLNRPDGGTAAIAGRAVHGLGGVGKTRAAVEYAWKHRDDYTALALLDAETPDKLQSNLAALTGPLRLTTHAAPEEAVRFEAALDWLNGNPGWFLILDNIDTEPALTAAHRLLGRLTGGHVVLTSRLTRFPREVERLDLDVLTLPDATAFLQEATPGRRQAADDAAQARGLAEALGQLALALEMAAATIEARGLSFAGYQTLWQGNRKRVIGWARQEITGYHHAVADEAEPLMRRALGIDEASYGNDHPDVATDLNNLAGLLRATNRLGEAEPLMRRALGIDEASYGNDHPRVAIPLNNLAQLLQDTNRLGEAEPLMRRALGIDEASYGNDHPDVATDLNNLAGLLQDTNRLGEAEPLMRRALGIDEASYGNDHPRVAIRLNNLAGLLRATNRLGEAEPLYRRALGIDEASYGNNHPSVAIRLNNLARLLRATNRLGEAEPLMRRHLVIFLAFQRDTGHAHPHRDAAIRNYTGLLGAMGKTQPEIDATLATLWHEPSLGTP
jgi:Tetratricopeptide repeat/Domain of unknown function (DUF4062)